MSLLLSTIITCIFGLFIIFIRIQSSKRPASIKAIVLPPIMMSTGALMFISPYFRVPNMEIFEALLLGGLFSIILIWTTKFEVKDDRVFIKRTKAFPFILMTLLMVRIFIKYLISGSIEFGELSGMFWIMAFAMIVPWRISMYFQYKNTFKQISKEA